MKDRKLNYNLLIPHVKQELPPPKLKLCDQLLQFKAFKKDTLQELLLIFPKKRKDHVLPEIPETQPNYIASILQCIKSLEIEASMTNIEDNMFTKVFQPIPHIDKLPLEPVAHITLKDAKKMI